MSDEVNEGFILPPSDEEKLCESIREQNKDLYFNPAKEERLKLCMQAFLAEYFFQQKEAPWKDEKQLDRDLFHSWHRWATLYTQEAGDQKPDDHLEYWLPQHDPEPKSILSVEEYLANSKKKLFAKNPKK